jgi:hypothetical protein
MLPEIRQFLRRREQVPTGTLFTDSLPRPELLDLTLTPADPPAGARRGRRPSAAVAAVELAERVSLAEDVAVSPRSPEDVVALVQRLRSLPHETAWVEFKCSNDRPEDVGENGSASLSGTWRTRPVYSRRRSRLA